VALFRRKTTSFLFSAGFLALAAVTIWAVVYLSGQYLDNKSASEGIAKCSSKGTAWIATIQNGKISPEHIEASLCDTLKITNKDDQNRLVTFGEHAHHISYDGVTQELLGKSQSLDVILNQRGTYEFHDHFEAAAVGYVTIN
jgi:hypothetical protein